MSKPVSIPVVPVVKHNVSQNENTIEYVSEDFDPSINDVEDDRSGDVSDLSAVTSMVSSIVIEQVGK